MPTTEELQEQSRTYVGPECHAGDIVNWYMDGNPAGTPRAALVERVHHRALDLFVLASDKFGLIGSVHHHEDPELALRPVLKRTHGVWEYRPQERARLSELAALRAEVAALQTAHASGNGHAARARRPLTAEQRQRARENLAKGRETARKNREALTA